MAKLEIRGRIPSKKNSRQQVRLGNGRRINIPSKKYKEWHNDATAQVAMQNIKPFKGIVGVEIDFYMPDNRKADLSNKCESIMDLLVDCGVIEDDCWQKIPHIILNFVDIDKLNPRAEIWIKKLEN